MLTATLLDRWEQVEPLALDWNALLRESASDTPFLTWEWVHSWWSAYGDGKTPHVLRFDRGGQLVGIAPFYRRRIHRYGVIQYDGLYLLGDGSNDSDYLDFIVRRGYESEVMAAVVDHLVRSREAWTLLFLNEVPEASPNLGPWEAALRSAGCWWRRQPVVCAEVRFGSTWDEYIRSLQPRMRTKIRSVTQRLDRSHQVAVRYCEDPSSLEESLESLFRLHQSRWTREGARGVFGSEKKRRFYDQMARRFLARGWLKLASLQVDGRAVAHQFCFEYGGAMFLLQEGYDPAWEQMNVGNALRTYIFRDCIERGVSRYDFLGGMTSHKRSWGARETPSVRLAIARGPWPGRLYLDSTRFVDRGRAWLKSRIDHAGRNRRGRTAGGAEPRAATSRT